MNKGIDWSESAAELRARLRTVEQERESLYRRLVVAEANAESRQARVEALSEHIGELIACCFDADCLLCAEVRRAALAARAVLAPSQQEEK